MVFTRSSSRRRLSRDVSSASSSKRPRRQQPSKPKPTLTTLPAEIRELNLKELLWQKEPIEFESGAAEKYRKKGYHDELLLRATPQIVGFDPNILRTCKQLYSESSNILYSNTVNCRVGRPFFDAYPPGKSDGPVVLSTRFCGEDFSC